VLSYAATDWSTYVSRPVAQRELRGTQDLMSMIELSLPSMRSTPRYAYLSPQSFRPFSLLRYYIMPSMPVFTEDEAKDLPVWVVFHRPDLVFQDGYIVKDGQKLSKKGSIKAQTNDSFLFVAE
jgi:hypothetical protein